MFGRDRAEVVTVPSGLDEPRLTRQQENERRAAVLERRLNTPSTFADRKAAAVAVEPQMVFMGMSDHVVTRGINDPTHEVIEVELWYERDHPARTYYRIPPHGVLQPTTETTGKETEVRSLGTLKTKPRFAGCFEPSPPDPPARQV
jgi:hypothetical protein